VTQLDQFFHMLRGALLHIPVKCNSFMD